MRLPEATLGMSITLTNSKPFGLHVRLQVLVKPCLPLPANEVRVRSRMHGLEALDWRSQYRSAWASTRRTIYSALEFFQ